MEPKFYQISDPTQDGPEESIQWVEQLVREGTICADCGGIITPKVIDVHIGEKIKKSFSPVANVRGTNFQIIRKDLLQVLGWHNIETSYFIGEVYDVNNVRSKDYLSLTPKFSVFIRGGDDSPSRECEGCKRTLYFPLPLGSWYLKENELLDLPLFPSALAGIIVNEEIYRAIKNARMKRIGIEKLHVKT